MESVQPDGLNRWEQAFFLLLRCGLWEEAPRDLSLFPLSDEEWNQVFIESRRQTVQGLLFRGFQQLPERLFPPQTLIMRWLADVTRIEQNYQHAQEATAGTCILLRKMGCEPVLLKGLAVGGFYEHPEFRTYGDVDWYVHDLPAIVERLHSEGIETEPHADRSHSFCYHNTEIELHDQLTDLQTASHQHALELLQSEGQPVRLTLPDGTGVTAPSPLQTLVILQTHILKHAVTVGVGLRQLCDLARAYHVYWREADGSRLIDYYCRLNLLRWTRLTHTFLYTYLGVPRSELPAIPDASAKACLRLAQAVLRWGNFGQHTSSWQASFRDRHTKLHTASQIARNLPFALQYAPCMAARHITMLIRNQ